MLATQCDAVDHHTDYRAAGSKEWTSRMAWLAVRCWKDEEDLFVAVALARSPFVRVHPADSVTTGIPIAYGRLGANAKQSTRSWRTVARHERRATASVTDHLQNGQVDLRVLEKDAGGQGEAVAEQ